ncbi:hypothetical protein SAMN05660865_00166 [Caloramator fervidus]|uniref:Uncharacterized protein n=1 Tax=Caloramator fervidus TaxID=29344 RepID=A0A1H5RQU3_9CLOT|nr:hypothetical protein [Caloramator fervidus]SEF40650.1 hypothetical protein SAMN05660865_00166 [Caloramator fervidus]
MYQIPMCPFMHLNPYMPNTMMPMMPMMPLLPTIIDLEETEDERSPEMTKVDEILKKIEKNDPQIFAILRSYGIPLPTARRIVRRIIRLTLMYSK